jgi:type II secretory pathway component PulF
MHIDLGALFTFRGIVFAEPMPTLPRARKSWWQRLFSGGFRRKSTARDLIQVTDQLHQLVTCQAPLAEGLLHAATDCPSAPVARQLYRLSKALEQGGTLAEGLGRAPTFCPRYYADLVGAAESSGHLTETLLELSRDLDQNLKTTHKLRSRTLYVLIVLAFTLTVGIFLNAKVFSVLDDVWGQFGGTTRGGNALWDTLVGRTAPFQERIASLVKACGELINQVFGLGWHGRSFWEGLIPSPALGLALGAILIVVVALVLSYVLRKPVRFVIDRLPVIRGAVFHARWGHALKIVSMLLERGIPLDRALDSAAASDVDRATRRVLLRMSEGTRAGLSFSTVLEKERSRTPRSMSAVVSFGSQVGQLPELLARLSHIYRLRAERTLRVVSDIAFPLAIIGCGVLISTVNARFFILMSNIVDGIMGNM